MILVFQVIIEEFPGYCSFYIRANYFERHFTLDRTWKGTDHAASLEPDGMREN